LILSRFFNWSFPGLALLFLCCAVDLSAHAVPDIPVQAFFEADGTCLIRVEVDPRCFATDPEKEPFLQNWVLERMTPAEKETLVAKARELVARSVELRFEPIGKVQPELAFRFTSHGDKPLQATADPVMVTGEWRTKIPAGLEGYRIKALPGEKLSVVMVNHLRGKPVERIHVLFPGETSYLLDLTGLTASVPTAPTPDAVGCDRRLWGDVPQFAAPRFLARGAGGAGSHSFRARSFPLEPPMAPAALAGEYRLRWPILLRLDWRPSVW